MPFQSLFKSKFIRISKFMTALSLPNWCFGILKLWCFEIKSQKLSKSHQFIQTFLLFCSFLSGFFFFFCLAFKEIPCYGLLEYTFDLYSICSCSQWQRWCFWCFFVSGSLWTWVLTKIVHKLFKFVSLQFGHFVCVCVIGICQLR